MTTLKVLCLVALAALVVAARPVQADTMRAGKLKVVASFSIIGDMVAEVGGDRIELTTLVGPDADAHVYQAGPAQARAVAGARLFFVNGLGFDNWSVRLHAATGSKARLVKLTDGIRALVSARGNPDPHAWQDVGRARAYVAAIERALSAADPAAAAVFRTNARAYGDELAALDAAIRQRIAAIPPARRRVVTSHDAFAYFGAAYGVTFVAPLGVSTEEQASARGVASLIRQIRRENLHTVFVENISDPRLIGQIARETGARLGGRLYSDALSPPGGPAATYAAMMAHNAKLLTGAMAPAS